MPTHWLAAQQKMTTLSVRHADEFHPGGSEAVMTMKIADAAPDEARLVEVSERLSNLLSATAPPLLEGGTTLDLDPSFLEASRELLAKLNEKPRRTFHGGVELTEQQIESYLDFSPAFLELAKTMLKDFIERTEKRRSPNSTGAS
jgi:hypothetical protein